jgi:sulfatase modifying factor 1
MNNFKLLLSFVLLLVVFSYCRKDLEYLEGDIGVPAVPIDSNLPIDTTQPLPLDTARIIEIEQNMAFVEGGEFFMGCTVEQTSFCENDENPMFNVILSDFYISKYEVTQAQWFAVMGTRPSWHRDCDECPVERVTWDMVRDFIRELNRITGKTYRLPTEAEWEYAARGGKNAMPTRYAGSNLIFEVAWVSESRTSPVGQKLPNEIGLYDMSGNVSEWCNDWYAEYTATPKSNPPGPSTGDNRVVRGGSYSRGDFNQRVSSRQKALPNRLSGNRGFRLARDE